MKLKIKKEHFEKMKEDEQGLMVFVDEEKRKIVSYVCSQNFGNEQGYINNMKQKGYTTYIVDDIDENMEFTAERKYEKIYGKIIIKKGVDTN